MTTDQRQMFNALLRQSLSAFTQKTFDIVTGGEPYIHNWHIDRIVEHLEACANGSLKRLIITVPPRSLKSICVSVAFPAWLLGHHPDKKIIAVSYAHDLALKHSIDCKHVMETDFYQKLFPGTRLSMRRNTQTDYMTTQKGFRLATSIGGTLTGRGGDFLIIDDPLKPQDALSDTSRKNVNEWYDNTLYSRLNNKEKGCIIIIMQRLHEDDLVGHVLEQEGWTHLSFPALAEHHETHIIKRPFQKERKITRRPGDPLHPKMESKDHLEKLRTNILGSYQFSAQYQQSPAPLGGGLIKWMWFNRYTDLPDEKPLRTIQSWDTASKTEEVHDYSVCTTWYEYKNAWYLVDIFRDRLEFPDLSKAICKQNEIHSPAFILIEDKGSGTQLIQDLRRSGKLSILGIVPEGDKATRMLSQTPKIESGNVYLPERAHWIADFENEIIKFPNGKHDDQIDSISQALKWMSDHYHYDYRTLFIERETPEEYRPIAPPLTSEALW